MLRFDPSGAVHPEYGVTAEQLQGIYPHLVDLRSQLVAPSSSSPSELGNRFYHLPSEQLEAYKQLRETSDLGRIFKVANSQMDLLDAVVIIAGGGLELGPLSLILANCDPYHNELRRGPRGGKPRIYFTGSDLDNDTLQALLSRIAAGGYCDNDVEDRWGIVAIGQNAVSDELAIAFKFLTSELKANLQGYDASLFGRFLVPILSSDSKLWDDSILLRCDEIFTIPDSLIGPSSVLSVVGMLPAAMLGLDIMKLLEGAVAMNEHFEATPPKANMVMQYVAINHLLEKHQGRSIRELKLWDASLESIGWWYERLLSQTFADHSAGWSQRTNVSTLGLSRDLKPRASGKRDRVVSNLLIQQCRTDPLELAGIGLENEITERYLPERLASKISQANDAHQADKQPSIDIILPTIDTFALGQLFQMLMIATTIEFGLFELESNASPTAIRTY